MRKGQKTIKTLVKVTDPNLKMKTKLSEKLRELPTTCKLKSNGKIGVKN